MSEPMQAPLDGPRRERLAEMWDAFHRAVNAAYRQGHLEDNPDQSAAGAFMEGEAACKEFEDAYMRLRDGEAAAAERAKQ